MPADSFLRFEDEATRAMLFPVLIKLYDFESRRVSGSHGGQRRFSSCIWTAQEALDHIAGKMPGADREDLSTRLHELIGMMSGAEERHMLRFPKDGVDHHITRVAEMVRTAGNLHEFQNRETEPGVERKFSIIDGTAWHPRLRFGAPRDIPPEALVLRVRDCFPSGHNLPGSRGGHPLEVAISDLETVMEAVNKKFGGALMFSDFQASAIVTALQQSWSEASGSATAVTAGTGMGKTLGFAIPVITDALIADRGGRRVCSQILVYPRNDLAKDQFSQITGMVKEVNKLMIGRGEANRCIGTALDADGRIKHRQKNYPAGIPGAPEWNLGSSNVYHASSITYGGDRPAAIVACSVESFRRRLRIPQVLAGLSTGMQRIVFDEIHLSSGTQGGHHSRLVSRCKQIGFRGGSRLTFMGVSATIAKPRDHISKIWRCLPKEVRHVESKMEEDGTPMGIMHHIMLRPRNGTPEIGALVDMTSAVTHQRRPRDFDQRPMRGGDRGFDYKALQKTVGFADSHEVVGNWYSFTLDNEATSESYSVRTADLANSTNRRPYSHWHERPLRIHAGGDAVCTSCQQMTHSESSVTLDPNQAQMFRERLHHAANGDSSSWNLPLIQDQEQMEVRGLETCPYLECGKCWWFSPRMSDAGDLDAFEERPDHPGSHSYRQSVRAKRHTGKTSASQDDTEREGKASANYSFQTIPYTGAYPRRQWDDVRNPIPHDIAIATPTLEVGVDMDNVSDVMTHKAIRNVSSYRQKVGRAGREPGTDATAVTLLSRRSQDFQHYRSMNRLVDYDISDPVPVADNNLAVLKHQAYEAVFDFIAHRGVNIERIPGVLERTPEDGDYHLWSDLNENIERAISEVCTLDSSGRPESITPRCDKYVRFAAGVDDENIRKRAAQVVGEHLQLFLIRTPTANGATVIQWLASRNSNRRLPYDDPNANTWRLFDDLPGQLPTLRLHIEEEDRGDFESYVDRLEPAVSSRDVDRVRGISGEMVAWGKGDPFSGILSHYATILLDSANIEPIAREIEKLEPRRETSYISTVMENCPCFRNETPYAPLKTLFSNPHEAPLTVEWTHYNARTFMVTTKEGLLYILPGMWTHRVFEGQRFFVMHRGQCDDDGTSWNMHLDGGAYTPELQLTGTLSQDQASRFSPLLDLIATPGMMTYKPTRVKVRRDKGSLRGENFVDGGRGAESRLVYHQQGMGDVQNGVQPMLRPRSFPVTWILSDASGDRDEASTYVIDGTSPANPTERSSHPALGHPLASRLFDSVGFDPRMKASRIAMGVARNNDVLLKMTVNERHSALSDTFQTHGIRFSVSPKLMEDAEAMGRDPEHPYDDRVLRMIGSWIRTERATFPNVNSFSIKPILDVLVDESWRQSNETVDAGAFPCSADQFIDLLFNSGNALERDQDGTPTSFRARLRQDQVAEGDPMWDRVMDEMRALSDALFANSGTLVSSFSELMARWYRSTMLNTLGLALAQSVADFAGVQGDSVSYTFVDNGESCHIDVFDDDAEGNGSTQLAHKYFHIPIEVRELAKHFDDRNLPTGSFMDTLERNLQMCPEHVLHSICVSDAESAPSRTPAWMSNETVEVRERYSRWWEDLEVRNTRQASLHNRRRFAIADADDQADQRTQLLELELALSLCDVGCPACSGDDFGNLFPPHLTEMATCRAVLDDVMGDWSDYDGYLRHHADDSALKALSGENVPSGAFIHVKGDAPGSLSRVQSFVQFPSPPVGFAWIRGMAVPEKMDFWVRHLELL